MAAMCRCIRWIDQRIRVLLPLPRLPRVMKRDVEQTFRSVCSIWATKVGPKDLFCLPKSSFVSHCIFNRFVQTFDGYIG